MLGCCQQCKTNKNLYNYAEQKTYHNRAHFSNSILIPLISMQFTDKVNWTLFDFVIAGALASRQFFFGLVDRNEPSSWSLLQTL